LGFLGQWITAIKLGGFQKAFLARLKKKMEPVEALRIV
jgi:hypothetical protein